MQIEPKMIVSKQNSLVKHLVKLWRDKEYRHKNRSVLIEGQKMVEEIGVRMRLKRLFLLEKSVVPSHIQYEELYFFPSHLIEKISPTPSPEPWMGEVALPRPQDLSGKKKVVVLDGVRDPGNVGTLLRTTLALSFEGIFFLHHCADPFHHKAIRAAKGATFFLPYNCGSFSDLLELKKKGNFHLYAADKKGKSVESACVTSPLLLVLGNESSGISKEVKEIGEALSIPLSSLVDSLNVSCAGAILMHAIDQKGKKR